MVPSIVLAMAPFSTTLADVSMVLPKLTSLLTKNDHLPIDPF